MTPTMYWIRPDRNKGATDQWLVSRLYQRGVECAAEAGLALEVVAVDDILLSKGTTGDLSVFVHGKQVHPGTDLFHTKLMTFPAYREDTWRHLTTQAILERAGFYVTVPLTLNVLSNDKLLAVLATSGQRVPLLPTVRVSTRQADHQTVVDLILERTGIDFPVIVKPADWGGGNGVLVAQDTRCLRRTLELAGASETTMLIQPWLGPGTEDVRVYCIDGMPYQAIVRSPAPDAVVANHAQGGTYQVVEVPSEVRAPAASVARTFGLPYVCVDFLCRDGGYWLSEVELDGGVGGARELEVAKFAAFRRGFDRFLRSGRTRPESDRGGTA